MAFGYDGDRLQGDQTNERYDGVVRRYIEGGR